TLRDRKIFVDTSYLVTSAFPTPENLYMVAEVRSKLLLSGVRLVPRREESQIVLEVRSGGIGIDRLEYLLGIPSVYLSNLGNNNVSNSAAAAGLSTPELAIVKNTKQKGYAGVAFVAYWSDTGEVVSSSGPFVGRTL